VREVNDTERRFTFEIVSPKCRHLLQADSERECNLWISSIEKAINDALNNGNTNHQVVNANMVNNNTSTSNVSFHSLNDFNGVDTDYDPVEQNSSELFLSETTNESNSSLNVSNHYLKVAEFASSSKLNSNSHGLAQNKYMTLTSNQFCCDCGAPEPTWVENFELRLKNFLLL
jgi:hypothetical protein